MDISYLVSIIFHAKKTRKEKGNLYGKKQTGIPYLCVLLAATLKEAFMQRKVKEKLQILASSSDLSLGFLHTDIMDRSNN